MHCVELSVPTSTSAKTLRGYLCTHPSFAEVTLHPPQLCRGNFAPPLSVAGVALHPLRLCGFNFAPPSTLRPFLCGVRKMRETKESKATHVTIFWNLARNPEKNSSKIRRKNAKFEVFAIELMNIH